MRRLLIVALAVGLFAAACGSGDDRQPTGTETSERAPRQASVMQQPQPSQPAQSAQAQMTQEQERADPGSEPDDAEPPATLPTDDVGEHKGVRSQRNLLGEPAAPILIEHFGDFT